MEMLWCGCVSGVWLVCVVREWLYCADLVRIHVDVSRSLWRPCPLLRRVIVWGADGNVVWQLDWGRVVMSMKCWGGDLVEMH